MKRFFLWIIRRVAPGLLHSRLVRRELRLMDAIHDVAWCDGASLDDRLKALRDQRDYIESIRDSLRQIEAVDYAVRRKEPRGSSGEFDTWKYFCAVCWGKVRDREAKQLAIGGEF